MVGGGSAERESSGGGGGGSAERESKGQGERWKVCQRKIVNMGE